MTTSNDLITIATYNSVYEAKVAKTLLESQEIPVFLADENTIGTAWHLSQALGGVRLCVPSEFIEDALKLLDEVSSNPGDAKENGTAADEENQVLLDAPRSVSAADRFASLSYKAAIVGLALPFVGQIYALVNALRAVSAKDRLSSKGKRHLFTASIISIIVISVYATFFQLS